MKTIKAPLGCSGKKLWQQFSSWQKLMKFCLYPLLSLLLLLLLVMFLWLYQTILLFGQKVVNLRVVFFLLCL